MEGFVSNHLAFTNGKQTDEGVALWYAAQSHPLIQTCIFHRLECTGTGLTLTLTLTLTRQPIPTAALHGHSEPGISNPTIKSANES